jgi:hypothetical protein
LCSLVAPAINRGYGDDKLGQTSGEIERYVGVKRRLVPEYKLIAISLGWEVGSHDVC